MKNIWQLFITGDGNVEKAKTPLANFVAALRDAGMTISNLQIVNGGYHPNFGDLTSTQTGWSMYVQGEGDLAQAYDQLPNLVDTFRDAKVSIEQPYLVSGELRSDLVEAGV